MAADPGVLIVDSYRKSARDETLSGRNYKGLTIHALPVIHEEVARVAARRFVPNGEVLDIASGSGALCLRLHDAGFAVTGCDIVPENFRPHDTLPFVAVNLNLPFSERFSKKFDAITATEIIEHVENPRHFLRECFALLAPGGTLVVTTPNIDSAFCRAIWIRSGTFRWFDDAFYRRDGHITPVPLFVLKLALAEAGFETPEISSIGEPDVEASWWKMHAFAWILRKLDPTGSPQKEILFAVAKKPA